MLDWRQELPWCSSHTAVVVGHEPGSVVGKLTAAADCGANGVVMSTFVLFILIVCSGESCRSAAEADPFVVVTYPVIDAGAPTAVTGTLPSEFPGWTPLITVAAYTTDIGFPTSS